MNPVTSRTEFLKQCQELEKNISACQKEIDRLAQNILQARTPRLKVLLNTKKCACEKALSGLQLALIRLNQQAVTILQTPKQALKAKPLSANRLDPQPAPMTIAVNNLPTPPLSTPPTAVKEQTETPKSLENRTLTLIDLLKKRMTWKTTVLALTVFSGGLFMYKNWSSITKLAFGFLNLIMGKKEDSSTLPLVIRQPATGSPPPPQVMTFVTPKMPTPGEIYDRCKKNIRFHLKRKKRSIEWLLRHKVISQEVYDYMLGAGKMKKYWK